MSDLAAARHDGSLGDDHIKLAQVLIMCSLPHSQTDKQQIVRKARLGDGTYLTVTFTSMLNGIPLPFGRDRKLLAWIFDVDVLLLYRSTTRAAVQSLSELPGQNVPG